MTTDKPALSTRLNQFWARMLAPINAYLGTALIALAVAIALIGLTGGHMGGHVDISVMRDGGDVSVRVQEGQTVSDRDRFELWNECKPVWLIVEDLSEDAHKIDLKKEDIEVTKRSRLRGARIYTDDGVVPYLYVVVTVVGKGFSISLELRKFVHDPLSEQSQIASTWLSGGTGTHADGSGYILSAVVG